MDVLDRRISEGGGEDGDGCVAARQRELAGLRDAMFGVALRILRNRDDAEDAVQDAMLSAMQRLQSFRGEAKLSTWMHRITVNAALMRLRARRRRPEEPLADDADVAEPPELPRAIDAKHRMRRVVQGLGRLREERPHQYRTFAMRVLEGADGEETARQLGLSPSAVKTHLFRARRYLRRFDDAGAPWAAPPCSPDALRRVDAHPSEAPDHGRGGAPGRGAALPSVRRTDRRRDPR